jgi:hypothetical protein
MQSGRRHLRTAVGRAGVIIGVVATAALLGAPGAASATAIGVGGSSNCAGPDAWVATWRISVTSASADETWRLDAPVGDAGFRSVAEPAVVERVHGMDEPVAQLDVAITLADAETVLSASASMDRPTVCTSAPAPPVTSGIVDPGDPAGDPVGDSTAASAAVGAALATTAPSDTDGLRSTSAPAPARSTAPVVAPNTSMNVAPNSAPNVAPNSAPNVAPAANELPATGSTTTALVGIALACVTAGGLLVRLAGGPMPALADGAGRRPGRQRRAPSPSPHPRVPDPAQRRQS